MQVHSEIAPLKKVILHKPYLALRHLTPRNCVRFLFDDVLWVEKASQEHDYFETILREHEVEVYLLEELLIKTIEDQKARDWLINARLEQLHHTSSLNDELKSYFDSCDAKIAASYLLGGMTLKDMDGKNHGLTASTLSKYDFVIPPLPNHLFTRDTSCWIGKGVSINPMHYLARRGETLNLAAIYKFHPMFKKEKFEIWYDGSEDLQLPSLEGGDVLVVSEDCILVGLSERTMPQAIEALAKKLFSKEVIKQVIAVELPKTRATMHLDTMMTMVNYDVFCTAFPDGERIRSWSIKPGDHANDLVVTKESNFVKALTKALDLKKIKMITPAGDLFTIEREQWNDSSNLLAIAPGKVIAYKRNVHMNAKLRRAGLTVYEIHGSELGRGRGGSRCMSCPILRESA